MNRASAFTGIPHGLHLNYAFVIRTLVFLTSFCLGGGLWAERHVVITYECEDSFAQIEVNGVSVVASRKDSFLSGQRFVDEWILPGTNEIAVRIQPAGSNRETSSCSLALYAVKSGSLRFASDSSEKAVKIYSFKWPESRTNAKALRTNETFWIDEASPSLLTSKGEVLAFTETDKSNARALVMKLIESVEKKNKNAFLALTAFQLAEKTRLRQDENPAFKKNSEERLLKWFDRFSGKSFKSKPLEWIFQSAMRGRLVRVLEKSGKSPLDEEGNEEGSTFPIYLGKVDGRWVLAR